MLYSFHVSPCFVEQDARQRFRFHLTASSATRFPSASPFFTNSCATVVSVAAFSKGGSPVIADAPKADVQSGPPTTIMPKINIE